MTSIKKEFGLLSLSILLALIVTAVTAPLFVSLRGAAQLGIGALFSIFNIYFYAMMAAVILVKKNIAWIGPVIVIKYLFLIMFIYVVATRMQVFLVLAGMFSVLLLTATNYGVLRFFFLRKEKNHGSL